MPMPVDADAAGILGRRFAQWCRTALPQGERVKGVQRVLGVERSRAGDLLAGAAPTPAQVWTAAAYWGVPFLRHLFAEAWEQGAPEARLLERRLESPDTARLGWRRGGGSSSVEDAVARLCRSLDQQHAKAGRT